MGNVFDAGYYLEGFLYGLVWTGASLAVSCCIYLLCKRKFAFPTLLGIVLLLTEVIMVIVTAKSDLDWSCQYFMVIPVVMILGACSYKSMESSLRRIYLLGMIMGSGSFMAVCLLTNLEWLSAVMPMKPASR